MSAYLLDVNFLVALMWPTHEAHNLVHQWFARHSKKGWATCPFTQAGFVRIVSNPAFSPDAVTPQEAIGILRVNCKQHFHHFWKDDIPVTKALSFFQGRLVGHRQITDAYLLALAIDHDGMLATLDDSISALVPLDSREHARVELIRE